MNFSISPSSIDNSWRRVCSCSCLSPSVNADHCRPAHIWWRPRSQIEIKAIDTSLLAHNECLFWFFQHFKLRNSKTFLVLFVVSDVKSVAGGWWWFVKMLETVSRRHQQPGSTLLAQTALSTPRQTKRGFCWAFRVSTSIDSLKTEELGLFLNIFCISISWLLSSLESN